MLHSNQGKTKIRHNQSKPFFACDFLNFEGKKNIARLQQFSKIHVIHIRIFRNFYFNSSNWSDVFRWSKDPRQYFPVLFSTLFCKTIYANEATIGKVLYHPTSTHCSPGAHTGPWAFLKVVGTPSPEGRIQPKPRSKPLRNNQNYDNRVKKKRYLLPYSTLDSSITRSIGLCKSLEFGPKMFLFPIISCPDFECFKFSGFFPRNHIFPLSFSCETIFFKIRPTT